MIREILKSIRMRTSHVSRIATRYQRLVLYGLDLVLWSRLLSSRRGPIPLELPHSLLKIKTIHCDPPALFVADVNSDLSHWEEGFRAVYSNVFLNLQTPDVISEIRYAHPAPSFKGVYLWDSAFTAQVWKHWDSEVAYDVNRAVINLRDGDRLQHVVSSFSQSAYTQPPVMAWSCMELLDWQSHLTKTEFRENIYQPLKDYHHWLYNHRQHENGLFFWAHPYESGIDNSPRFSTRDESKFADTTHLASPDLCSYIVLQNESLAKMAEYIGQQDAVHEHLQKASQLSERMNEFLWDETDKFYYDLNLKSGEFVRSQTIAGLLPMWAGVPDQSQAEALRQLVLNPECFNTRIPLPTVSREDPDFAKDMWRGPVWINTAYAVILAMERYGYREEVAELSYRLCEGVYRTFQNLRRFYEFYDPERFDLEELNRKKGNRFKHLTLGSKPVKEFVGWTGLINPLVIEQLIGLKSDHGQLLLSPNFPAIMRGKGFSLRLPERKLCIYVEVLINGDYQCQIYDQDGLFNCDLKSGESYDFQNRRIISDE
ncbi:MAG TPA: hypothetical protein DIW81_01240 [Planctomycetaceae bacterium]|nr:hypothetical protein [Planctomycetaceae bacterium]